MKKSCNNCIYLTIDDKCSNVDYLDARRNFRSTGKGRLYCKWHKFRKG